MKNKKTKSHNSTLPETVKTKKLPANSWRLHRLSGRSKKPSFWEEGVDVSLSRIQASDLQQ